MRVTGTGASSHVPAWASLIREQLAASSPRHEMEEWLVPGLSATESRRYREFFPRDPIAAAVLVPLVERDAGLTVLFTQRNASLRHHPGQVSFPGGRRDPPSESPSATALREAREEIGLDPARVEIAGYLPDHIVISGFRVTPVVGFLQPGFALALQAEEVEDVFEVPVSYLFDPANQHVERRPVSRKAHAAQVEVRTIAFGKHRIWGATAGMLMTLYRLCAGEPEGADLPGRSP